MKLSPSIQRSLMIVLGIFLGFQPIWIASIVDYYFNLNEVTGFSLLALFPLAGITAGIIPSNLLDGIISGVSVGLISYIFHIILFYTEFHWYPEVLLEVLGIPASIIIFGLLGAAIRLHINNLIRNRKEKKKNKKL